MAVLEILQDGNPILRTQAQPVAKITKKITKLIHDMIDTMYAGEGIGLAAPQVGVSLQIIVVDIGDGPFAVTNPQITASTDVDVDVEGCLSVRGQQGYVKRAASIVVDGLDEKGQPTRIRADGLLARVIQHEIDHLRGILFTDKLEPPPELGDGEKGV